SNSTGLVADFHLLDLSNGAEFTVQCPATAAVKLVQGATSITLSTTATVNDSVTFPGRTVTANVPVAGTINVQIEANAPATEYWEIQALAPAASSFAVSAAPPNATIRRVLADPNLPPSALLSFKEHLL